MFPRNLELSTLEYLCGFLLVFLRLLAWCQGGKGLYSVTVLQYNRKIKYVKARQRYLALATTKERAYVVMKRKRAQKTPRLSPNKEGGKTKGALNAPIIEIVHEAR